MRKIFILTLMAVLATSSALAVPARRQAVTVNQSDGTTITVTPYGDEFNHGFLTDDGKVVVKGENGDFYYRTPAGVTTMRAHNSVNRTADEQAFVTANELRPAAIAAKRVMPRAAGHRAPAKVSPMCPTIGKNYIPVILVNYKDKKFKSSDPVTTFKPNFSEGNASCHQYFIDQSRGQYDPQFELFGPVQLSQNRSDYGANDASNNDQGVGTMVAEAVKKLDAQEDIDWAKYDNDKDGHLDCVIILYAGVGEAQASYTVPSSIWPCQWDLDEAYAYNNSDTGPFEIADGVTVNRFAVFNELMGSSDNTTTIDGIGTVCHEFSHCLGLPDFYDTYGSNYGMDAWDLMDYGCYNDDGRTPVGYNSYERNFMGWMDFITPQVNKQYELAALNTDAGTAMKLVSATNANEYFILENRQKTGWDRYMDSHGMLIIHVDYDQSIWENNIVNANINVTEDGVQYYNNHERFTIVPADNSRSSSNNSGDLYPNGGSNTSFTDTSRPAAKLATGNYLGQPVTEITETGGVISLWYMKGVGPVIDTPEIEATPEEEVTATSFVAHWSAVDDVESYTLEVKLKGDEPESVDLLTEEFPTAVFDAEGTRDLGQELDDYMTNAGWSGANIYKAEGGVRLGSSRRTGNLASPTFAIPEGVSQITVTLNLESYVSASSSTGGDKDVPFTVTVGNDTRTLTINELQSHQLVFDVEGLTEATLTLATTTERKRVIVKYISVFTGDATTEAPRRAASETGDETYRLITGITDTQYKVEGLTQEGTYTYRVKAIGVDGNESDWSSKAVIALPAGEFKRGDVNGDNIVDIQDVTDLIDVVLGNKRAADLPGDCHVAGNNTIDVTDVTALIDIVLGNATGN